MKHWKESSAYHTMPEKVISLAVTGDEENGERVLAVAIESDGKVQFVEQCDGWFGTTVTPEQAVEILEEAIAWIRQNTVMPANAGIEPNRPR